MEKIERYKIPSMMKAYLASDIAHITDKSFKVIIPSLMVKIPKDGINSFDQKLDVNKNGCDTKIDNTISLQKIITAKSMTDYNSYHLGMKLTAPEYTSSSEENESMSAGTIDGVTELDGAKTHDHPLKKAFKMLTNKIATISGKTLSINSKSLNTDDVNEVKLWDTNDVTIRKGHEMIGIFIDDNLDDFRIIHIDSVIPLRRD